MYLAKIGLWRGHRDVCQEVPPFRVKSFNNNTFLKRKKRKMERFGSDKNALLSNMDGDIDVDGDVPRSTNWCSLYAFLLPEILLLV